MSKHQTSSQRCTNLLAEISMLFTKENTRSTGFFLLNEIDTSHLKPQDFLKYCFLQGKHLTLLYKNSQFKNPAILNQANLWFDELVQFAVDNNISIQQEYFYLRLKTKWLIASHISNETKKSKMISKLQILCKHALACFPKSLAIKSLLKTIQI